MGKSRRSRSRKRSRKRRGGLNGAPVVPVKTGVYQRGDMAMGKGAAAAVKKGVASLETAKKMCENITNQFARKICTEKAVKAQKKRAALAAKALAKTSTATAAAKKKVSLVQSRIGAIEKDIASRKTAAAAAAGGGKRKRRRTKRRRKRRKSKSKRRRKSKSKRRRKSRKTKRRKRRKSRSRKRRR